MLSVHPDYVFRNQIIHEMDQKWLDISQSGRQDIVVGLMRERQYELAMEKLEFMEMEHMKVDEWIYDVLTYMLCEHEEFDYALRIMHIYSVF